MASWHIPVHGSPLLDLAEDFFGDLTFPPLRYLPMFYNLHSIVPATGQPLKGESARERDRLYRQLVGHVPYGATLKGTTGEQEDKFGVKLDVKHYKPDEISVKVDGQTLTVTGKHYNETDTGYESCNFKRTYTVPETINTKNLASHISEDGILTLEAPKETKQEEGQVSEKKENYQLSLDVSGYKPEEISVRVDGKDLIIRGETKEEHEGDIGKSIRHHHFTWLYNLPNDIDAAALSSRCTKDGKLTIEAPRMEPPQPRSLQIMKE